MALEVGMGGGVRSESDESELVGEFGAKRSNCALTKSISKISSIRVSIDEPSARKRYAYQ